MNDDELVRELCRQLATATDSGLIGTGGAAAEPHDVRRRARALIPLAEETTVTALAEAAIAQISGLGPLQRFLADPLVDEIMVNNGGDVWVERLGTTALAGRLDPEVTPLLIERILNPLGRRLDRVSPVVDARLADGTRVCAVIPPVAIDGACLALRRFATRRRSIGEFASADVTVLLHEIIDRRCNVLISGATSSGKTSLLNALMARVGPSERIITLEDTAELRLDAGHVLRLETRPPTVDGTPAVTLADLVRTALRLRPDRIVVGEVRGIEVVDMLQAMNTGHDGSLTTCHANGPLDALRRLQSLVIQNTNGWPTDAIREHVCSSLDVVVHVVRAGSGTRQVTAVVELEPPASGGGHRFLCRSGEIVAPLQRRRA